MENNKKTVHQYFTRNAVSWVTEQYEEQDYIYPVGPNRIRIMLHAISEHCGGRTLKTLDIGCGGGTLCAALSQRGHEVTAVDLSADMLQLAEARVRREGDAAKVRFIHGDIESTELSGERFHAIAALGLYEYLDDREAFLKKVAALLEPDGIAVIDFRNRLFNMFSISPYTEAEIADGTAAGLIAEINELYSAVPPAAVQEWIAAIAAASANLAVSQDIVADASAERKPEPAYAGTVTATQQTPQEVRRIAQACGLRFIEHYGIHPHLLPPRLNRLLPPQVFNKLSDSLLPFERLPVSLVWSSKFIGVFKKAAAQ